MTDRSFRTAPDQPAHSCQPCKDARRASVTPDLIRRIREQAKETR